METIGIKDVYKYTDQRGITQWYIEQEKEDGRPWFHVMPLDSFQNRAAEYALPAGDKEAALEVMLHEPFIPSPVKRRNFAADAAFQKGLVVKHCRLHQGFSRDVKVGEIVPMVLWNAPDTGKAGEAHQHRIAKAKTAVKYELLDAKARRAMDAFVDGIELDSEYIKLRGRFINEKLKALMEVDADGPLMMALEKKLRGLHLNEQERRQLARL